jgi:hypothetical protein
MQDLPKKWQASTNLAACRFRHFGIIKILEPIVNEIEIIQWILSIAYQLRI